jgi:ubiquinone/menaquinone biosynthesis C-methylase UbiE
MIIPPVWKFDNNVAANFVAHARQHIPNYDLVIDKAVAVCQHLFGPDDAIIDVGCATGETLRRLSQAGFQNLVGVDCSSNMLDHCQAPARLILSDQLPQGPYHAVICNWTLHFIVDKQTYLKSIYQQLVPGGILFLTDKTSKNPLAIEFYHRFKHQQGVSQQEIIDKARSVESIMFIDSPAWYFDVFSDLNFHDVLVADASWCFTTFLAKK